MSDQRRFGWRSGGLTRSPISGFWAITLDTKDPQIPNLPILEPSAGDAAAITGAGGIASAEAFGSPGVSVRLDLTGIPGAEAFGSPTLTVAYEITGAGNIVSAEAFGSPVVTLLGVIQRKSLRFLGWPTPYGVSIARRRKR